MGFGELKWDTRCMDGFSVGFLNNLPKLISLVLGLGTHQCDNLRTVAQNYFLFIFTTYVYMQVAINLTFLELDIDHGPYIDYLGLQN